MHRPAKPTWAQDVLLRRFVQFVPVGEGQQSDAVAYYRICAFLLMTSKWRGGGRYPADRVRRIWRTPACCVFAPIQRSRS